MLPLQAQLAALSAPLLAAAGPGPTDRVFAGTLAQFDTLYARNPLAALSLCRPAGDMPADYLEKAVGHGNLVKKQITDSTGKKTTVWVRANGEELGSEDRQQVGQKPPQAAAAPAKAHPADHLQSLAEEAPTAKLLQHANDPNNPRNVRNTAKHELGQRGVDVAAELAKLAAPANTKAPAKAAKPVKEVPKVIVQDGPKGTETTSTKIDSDKPAAAPETKAAAAAAAPSASAPEPKKTGKVAPGSAPGTPADWEGDQSFSPAVQQAYNTNLKGIVKTVDKMIVGNAVTGIIYGEGGAGKTYNVEKTLKARGMVPMLVGDPPVKNGYLKITGKITPKAVYEQLYRYKDNLIIFDDCDSALANEDVVNMFKGALDTAEKRMVARVTPEGAKKPAPKAAAPKDGAAYQKELATLTARVRKGDKTLTDADYDRWHGLKTGKITAGANDPSDGVQGAGEAEIPGQFEFKGKVLFISNKKPDPEALQPILSRGSAHNASMEREEMLFAMSKNLPFIGVRGGADGKPPVVPFKEREEIYDFIKDNEKLFPDITMRHFGQVYEDKKYAEANGEDWQQEVRETLAAQAKEKTSDKVKKSFHDDPDFIEKGSLKPVGTITTLKDGRQTIKTKKGWRILYEGKGKVSHRQKKAIATNFEHAGKKYKVEHQEGQRLSIQRADGSAYKYANSQAVVALKAAYQTSKLAEWASAPRTEWQEGMSSGDFSDEVARRSQNPAEVALEWLNAPEKDELSHADAMIAEHLSSFPPESWARFGDNNQLTGTRIKASYLKAGGTPLDVQAENISHTAGIAISEDDIIDFCMRYPKGAHTADGGESEARAKLAGRFERLTGTQVSAKLASQAAALHTVDELSDDDRLYLEAALYADTSADWPWDEVPAAHKIAVTDDSEPPF